MKHELLHVLWHSLGRDDKGRPWPEGSQEYRNYYCDGIPLRQDVQACVHLGLMIPRHRINEGRDLILCVTDAGRQVALENMAPLPKLTRSQKRYRQFLRADSGLTFGEWIRG